MLSRGLGLTDSKVYIILNGSDFMERPYDLNKQKDQRLEEVELSGNAVEYFILCNSWGIPPRNQDLYSLGQAEIIFRRIKSEETTERRTGTRKKTLPDSVYLDFLQETGDFNLNDFERICEDKRELLIKYFPYRFGSTGKTPVWEMDDKSVSALFKRMGLYARGRVEQ